MHEKLRKVEILCRFKFICQLSVTELTKKKMHFQLISLGEWQKHAKLKTTSYTTKRKIKMKDKI